MKLLLCRNELPDLKRNIAYRLHVKIQQLLFFFEKLPYIYDGMCVSDYVMHWCAVYGKMCVQ